MPAATAVYRLPPVGQSRGCGTAKAFVGGRINAQTSVGAASIGFGLAAARDVRANVASPARRDVTSAVVSMAKRISFACEINGVIVAWHSAGGAVCYLSRSATCTPQPKCCNWKTIREEPNASGVSDFEDEARRRDNAAWRFCVHRLDGQPLCGGERQCR